LITGMAHMTGGMSDVMAAIPGTREQKDLRLLVLRADAAVRAEQAIEARKTAERDDLVQRLCDGISQMQRRLDAYAEREALRRELDAQSQQIVDTYSIPADLKDPDPTALDGAVGQDAEAVFPAQEGDYPAPSLYPSLREADGRVPGNTEREPPRLEEALTEDDTDATGPPPYPLPLDLATPATRPVVSPAELRNPQNPQEQPTAIDL
jgi:hypothetical protein